MFMKRFFEPKLAQTSYVIGCPGAKAAIVIDANRDIEQYIRAAESEGVSITHVTETHIHADYVSGSRELAARTGAKLLLSDEGDASWKYTFAKDAGATLLKPAHETSWGGYSGYFADPDGHPWEVAFNPHPIGGVTLP